MDGLGIAVFNFVLIVGLIFLFCSFIYQIPSIIRYFRLKSVAKNFNLSIKGKFLNLKGAPEPYKKNIIQGLLNGKKINIYDLYRFKQGFGMSYDSSDGPRSLWTRRNTYVEINGEKEKIGTKENKFAKVVEIRDFLKSL